MASASVSSVAEGIAHNNTSSQVNVIGDEPASPFSERVQVMQQATSSTTSVMEPSSMLQSVATRLLDLVRHTCGVLGYLAACLPLVEAEQRLESDIGMMHESALQIVNNSTIGASELYLEAKHKVFLSHSGAQKDFVEQLCVDLERCDRYPFFDKLRTSLPIGKIFPKLIFDAIKQCQVGVVVLSEEFFMSKWPMLELHAMMKEFQGPNSRITIVPVFYRMSVEALKNPDNIIRWTSQWVEWASNDDRIIVDEWKMALKKLGSINGIVMKEGLGDVKLREEIVAHVCGLVPCETRWDDFDVQGCLRICKIIQDKIHQVQTNLGVCHVGMYGMAGVGKTTNSKALCNDFAPKLCNKVCHIELGSGSELELLRKALKKLTNIRHDILDKLEDVGEGYAYLKRLPNDTVFLVLDNVQYDHKCLETVQRYLKAGYGCKSVVLVTARSLEVLKGLNVSESNYLEMPELDEDEARSLFLKCASLPLENEVDEVLIKECIERCHFLKGDGSSNHYHPLALKVLGQQFGCNPRRWGTQLRRMKSFNQHGEKQHPVFSILRNSFDSLEVEHQLIFMDLALLVLFEYDVLERGLRRRDWLCMVHERSVEDMNERLQVLKAKSLVEELGDDFTEIGMHDLWIEFAVAETKAQDSGDRRWVYQLDPKRGALGRGHQWRKKVERMVFLEDGWKALEGLNLNDFENVEAFKLEVELYVPDCELHLDLSGMKHLRSLEVDTPCLAVTAHGLSLLTNLVFLYYDTPGFAPCLAEIGHLTNLQFLLLSYFKGVEVLDLTELRSLRTAGIQKLPDLVAVKGLSSRMTSLRFLGIYGCKSLRECPGMDELYALEVLSLRGCRKLEELPCLGRLTKLRALNIDNCKCLRAVPGLGDLVALEEFSASECWKLATLPDLAKLKKLQELNIWECPAQEVPGLDGLISLTSLLASFGDLLGEQPDLSKLSALKDVFIAGWNGPIWTGIRSLLLLEFVGLYDCCGEDVVPDVQNLSSLKTLWLGTCEYRDLSGLSNATALEGLWIADCEKLERLPEFERLTNLTVLSIRGCDDLRDWTSCESTFCSLKILEVDGSSLMRIMRVLETGRGLRKLLLWGRECENVLSILASLLPQLEILEINDFSTMEALDVSIFPHLQELELDDCSALERVMCSKPLAALEVLRMIDCESLVEIPDLSAFPHLEKLRLEKCRALTRLSCGSPLTDLRKIQLIGCGGEVEVPEWSMFPHLEAFRVEEDSSCDDDDSEDADDGGHNGDDCQVVTMGDMGAI